MSETIPQAFAAAVRRDPTTPLLTFYDDTSGDRTELSGATLDNWVAKTANMLIDGAGLGEGDTVTVLLPPHWQTAAVLLGAWAAGLAVDLGDARPVPGRSDPDATRVGRPGPGAPRAVDALFAAPDRIEAAAGWRAGERYATGLLPLAMPLRQVPPGYADYVVEVRAFGDRFVPVRPVTGDDQAYPAGAATHEVATTATAPGGATGITKPGSHRDLTRAAAGRARELGLASGDRVLIDARAHPDPVEWLLAPLVAGASMVLCANLDPAALTNRTAAERVTVTLA